MKNGDGRLEGHHSSFFHMDGLRDLDVTPGREKYKIGFWCKDAATPKGYEWEDCSESSKFPVLRSLVLV